MMSSRDKVTWEGQCGYICCACVFVGDLLFNIQLLLPTSMIPLPVLLLVVLLLRVKTVISTARHSTKYMAQVVSFNPQKNSFIITPTS